MVKSCIKKLRKCLKKNINIKFIVCYKTTKMSFYTNTKDKTPLLSQSSLVYKFTFPGCSSSYVDKTDRTLFERTEEHAYLAKRKMMKMQSLNIFLLVHIMTIYGTYLI